MLLSVGIINYCRIKRLQLSTSDVDKRSSYLMQLVEEKNLNIQVCRSYAGSTYRSHRFFKTSCRRFS